MAPPRSNYFDAATAALIASIALTAAFAYYLYQPYLPRFAATWYATPASGVLAATGCFLLSRRWLSGSLCSVAAAVVYAFNPFSFAIATYHPAVSLLYAAIPWLLVPAARWMSLLPARYRYRIPRPVATAISLLLTLLPFLAIAAAFNILPAIARLRLFPMPLAARLEPASLLSMLAPMERYAPVPLGLYHSTTGALVIGIALLLKLRRPMPVFITVAGFALAFSPPILSVSPVFWAALPVLAMSLLVGLGLQGLLLLSAPDRRLLYGTLAATAFLTAASLAVGLLYPSAVPSAMLSGRLYLAALLPLAVITAAVRANLRLQPLRWLLLAAALAIDIFCSARILVDQSF